MNNKKTIWKKQRINKEIKVKTHESFHRYSTKIVVTVNYSQSIHVSFSHLFLYYEWYFSCMNQNIKL